MASPPSYQNQNSALVPGYQVNYSNLGSTGQVNINFNQPGAGARTTEFSFIIY